ncbi:hypothetical protein MUB23_10165 [Cuneatibacter sp. NSJ-177]|uniref:hypothetical protein n=1 Tax=Cuneatibacter sp. NSJ-177 TaxID=2931401 RepID=UPI001FD1B113|nr:hypothetical protein [Cuneatibacter sp. NSJ-177]MCJ7835751.1 hypothetical protein [Cuneatibacter sp. NSJ-177]
MITSIYLSNRNIQVTLGDRGKTGQVKKSFSVQILEGSLLNGMVTDEAELTRQLEEIWSKYQLPKKNVELVVDSSRWVSKVVTAPQAKPSVILKNLPLEFADSERQEDACYDYMTLRKLPEGKLQEVMAIMGDSAYVENYCQIFQHIGVELTKMTSARTSAIKLLTPLLAPKKQTCVVMILDGSTLNSMLWLNGAFAYVNKKRLFCERGGAELGMELVRNISSMIQFHASLKSGQEVKSVYLCGVSETELDLCRDSAEAAGFSLGINRLPSPEESEIYSAGNLYEAPKDINLIQVRKKQKKADGGLKKALRFWAFPLILLGVLLAGFAVIWGINFSRENTVKELDAYLMDPENLDRLSEADELEMENQALLSIVNQLEQASELVKSYPWMDTQVALAVETSCPSGLTVEIKSYAAEEGKLTMEATFVDVTKMNQYVDALSEAGCFDAIGYSGYALKGDGAYLATVTVVLSEEAGK